LVTFKISRDEILPTAKTKMQDMMPICQDKFDHVGLESFMITLYKNR